MTNSPNPNDVALGARIRFIRRKLGMSQEKLAGACGLSFQQIQKYELGKNRISYSKLREIAEAFKTTVAAIVAPLDKVMDNIAPLPGTEHLYRILHRPEGMALLAAIEANPAAGKAFLALAAAFSDEFEEEDKAAA